MTDITPLIRADTNIIQAYGPGGVTVNGRMVAPPCIITPDTIIAWDGTAESLVALAGQVELVLCARNGNNDPIALMPWRVKLRAVGMSIEPMDLGAVCRTYNVLMAEGRKIAAVIG